MTEQEANEYSARRKTYFTLALVALALTAGRISVVTGRDGTTAFLSANDRSRWCTVASLVEHGTYAIDTQIEIVDPIRRHIHPWQTIDKVRHLGPDDQQHYYSSKPPLFPTIVAGVYQIVQLATGISASSSIRSSTSRTVSACGCPTIRWPSAPWTDHDDPSESLPTRSALASFHTSRLPSRDGPPRCRAIRPLGQSASHPGPWQTVVQAATSDRVITSRGPR